MKIKFSRRGGFANIPVNVEVDTATVDANKGQELQERVKKLLPFPAVADQGGKPDVFNYTLEVEDDDKQYVLAVDDLTATDDMQDLFGLLMD